MDNEMNTMTTVAENLENKNVEPVQEPTFKGHIRHCTKLNVRLHPNINARVVRVIGVNDEVEIDRKNSTEEFWKVRLESGIEGYCMKRFIKMVKL